MRISLHLHRIDFHRGATNGTYIHKRNSHSLILMNLISKSFISLKDNTFRQIFDISSPYEVSFSDGNE